MSLGYIVKAGTEQRLAWIGGSVHHIVLDGAATANRLTAVRSTMRHGTASPVHVHDAEDETIFVLQGRGTVWVGDRKATLGPGDTAFLPRGVPHTYRFTSETAELLTVCNPSGMEEFFRRAGWDLTEPQPEDWTVDMHQLAAAAEETGQRLLGPPLDETEAMPGDYLTEQALSRQR